MPRYQGYIPKIFLTVWSLMNHLLCFANLIWFRFGISHVVMFCFTLVFNFLLVWVTTLTLLKPNRMQLPRAQTVSLAGEPHSRVWQGTWYGTFPPPASPFHSFACSGDDFGITPRALGRGRPGVNNNMQGKTREAYRSGATYFNQRGSPVPCLQHVLYMGLHSLWEWQRTICLFVCFSLAKLLTFSPHTASTAGCLKSRGHRHVVNRIRARTFTEHRKAAMKCKIYDSLDCCSQDQMSTRYPLRPLSTWSLSWLKWSWKVRTGSELFHTLCTCPVVAHHFTLTVWI